MTRDTYSKPEAVYNLAENKERQYPESTKGPRQHGTHPSPDEPCL